MLGDIQRFHHCREPVADQLGDVDTQRNEAKAREFVDDDVRALFEPAPGSGTQTVTDRPPATLARPSGRVVRLEGDDTDQLLEVILVARKLDAFGTWTGAIEQTLASLAESDLVEQQLICLLGYDNLEQIASFVRLRKN